MTGTIMLPKARSGPTAARAVMIVALASMLAACAADRVATGSTRPHDYRERHPIVLAEGARTLDVFVHNPGGLDVRQQDDLRAFVAEYRRYGQAVMTAQIPVGTHHDAAARATMAHIADLVRAAGVPAGYLTVATYPVADGLVPARTAGHPA